MRNCVRFRQSLLFLLLELALVCVVPSYVFPQNSRSRNGSSSACSSNNDPVPQTFTLLLRDEENWTGLLAATEPPDGLDVFKCIPLRNAEPEYFISFGGEAREWFEHFDNEGWGTIRGGDNYLLQRYMAHADIHLSPHLRFFFQLKSGIEEYRKVGPRPFDADRLDFNQGYIDIKFGSKLNTQEQAAAAAQLGTPSGDDLHPLAILRLGRQELNFGAGRLISASEGVNVRFGFDAARIILQPGSWRIDAFVAKPDEYHMGVFDDGPTPSQTLAGVYATTPINKRSSASLDIYYFNSDFKFASYVQGIGRDHRQTLGTRFFNINPASAWNYDVEGTLQFGTFKPMLPSPSGQIQAWGISPFLSYGFIRTRLKPRLAVNGGITSGDKNPNEGRLQSFSSLFARGDYFGDSKQIGPINVASFQPKLTLAFPHGLSAIVDTNFLWRESTRDGLYTATGMPVRSAGGSPARYVGAAPEVEVRWQSSKRVSFDLIYQRYIVGRFLQQQPPGGIDQNYVAASVTLKF